MSRPKFTIIIPVFNRVNTIRRCLVSALTQTYGKDLKKDYEVVVVDDGSFDGTEVRIDNFHRVNKDRMKVVRFPKNRGRIAARNAGLEKAKGEFIIWLDSDDELLSTYLEVVATAIKRHPDRKLFTCGAAVYNEKSISFHTRDTFIPEAGDKFKSGKIGSGSFIFKKSIGFILPVSEHAYGGDGSFSALIQRQVPEIKELYGQNEDGSWLPFGNPWGDDYAMFFLLTRKHKPVGIMMPLYIQHVRP